MSEAVAAYAPPVAVPAVSTVRPTGAEVLAAGLAAIALTVLQLVLAYGVPVLLWRAHRSGLVIPNFPQLVIDFDLWLGAGRWVLVAGWFGAVWALRKRRWRGAFVIGSSLLAIALVTLTLTFAVLASLAFVITSITPPQ